MSEPRTLSVVIPAYNEERFIDELVRKVLAVDLSRFRLGKDVIVIDDGSRDGTADIVESIDHVRLIRKENGGKGSAVRAGIAAAEGDLLMIQDADLEYAPDDYVPMIAALLHDGVDAVYGSRYLAGEGGSPLRQFVTAKHDAQSWAAYLGGRSLSFPAWLLCNRRITDTVTALKLFYTPMLKSLSLETTGFETDHEITAKYAAAGKRIVEVPVRYFPRSKDEGKKIGLSDWLKGVRTFARYRNG